MRQNCECRAILDLSKNRNQDVAKILHGKIIRDARISSGRRSITDGVLVNFTKSMYSEGRVPGLDLIRGLIATAKSFSPQLFDVMLGFPFEVPRWFFTKCLAAISKLSGVSPPPPQPALLWRVLCLMYTLPTTSPVRLWMLLRSSFPDEQKLEALKGIAHHTTTSGIAASYTRAATLLEYDRKLHEAGWASLISLTFIDFCQKAGQIPVSSSSANRPLDC
jgi:hypothetical protein